MGPASFTQVQVAWHHGDPLVTAPDPLHRRCRLSPSLAARHVFPRVGSIAIIVRGLLPYTAAHLPLGCLCLSLIRHRSSWRAAACRADTKMPQRPIPTGDRGSLQREHAGSRSHSSINISQLALQYQYRQNGKHGCLA